MIKSCPFCGHSLQKELQDGLTSCCNCEQVFDTSELNKLLSASWLVRKNHYNREQLKWHTKLDDELITLVMTFVSENSYSHQEFIQFLKRLGRFAINQKSANR
jgi:Zn-finger nucleic acid-binding protein